MPRTVILSSARTPIGKLGGGLSSLPATHLGAVAIREALERADVAPEQIEHVVMGTVLQAGQGQIPTPPGADRGRDPDRGELGDDQQGVRLRRARRGDDRPAVRAGDLEVAVGGGMESMSQAPYLLPGARQASAWATSRRSTR